MLRSAAEDQFGGLAEDTLEELERVTSPSNESIEASVVAALDEARRGLGEDGRFAIRRSRNAKPLVFDVEKLRQLRERAQRAAADNPSHPMVVSGWLHMVDLEPDEIVIGTPEGIEWRSTYKPELEQTVRSLVGEVVLGTGIGSRTGPGVGRLELETISRAPQLSVGETYLVDGLRGDNKVIELMESQDIHAPQHFARPAALDEADALAFLSALGRLHESQ